MRLKLALVIQLLKKMGLSTIIVGQPHLFKSILIDVLLLRFVFELLAYRLLVNCTEDVVDKLL